MPERDLFANFDRMRREMDELFGDVLQRSTIASRRRPGFVPRVDVYYCGEPPRAVVVADLAGISPDEVGLEVQGRRLVIAGHRRAGAAEGRVYQQIEIEHGPFKRVVELGAEVRADAASATYEHGLLRVELPLVQPTSRSVPIATPHTGTPER